VRTRGFTLIEVLVALAIVTIGMAAVMGALNSSADTLNYLRDKSFSQWVAENKIANTRISGAAPSVGNSSGDVDFAGRSWHWRMEVVATEIPGMVRMDVHVRPADVKGDDDGPWFTTMSGLYGDAIGQPNGYQPSWGVQTLPGQGPMPGGRTGIGALGSQSSFGVQGVPNGGGTLGAPGSLGGASQGIGGNSSGLGGGSTLGGPSSFGSGGSSDSDDLGGPSQPQPQQPQSDQESPQ
jgi:general secretion pathway protein I